jgi:hypothetical protein
VAALSRSSVCFTRASVHPAHMRLVVGYLDPGSGSMILQALAGGLAGIAVVGKVYWRRIKRVFARRDPSDELG